MTALRRTGWLSDLLLAHIPVLDLKDRGFLCRLTKPMSPDHGEVARKELGKRGPEK